MGYDPNCRLFPFVQKPSRYIGSEPNTIIKDSASAKVSFALTFPDVYEIGMSHLGLRILYAILNSLPNVVAERCYAPWLDMENIMRSRNLYLTTRESGNPLKNFDVVGFSLQYELSYTNCLNMMELGGITIAASRRREDEPIVIAGGPCAYNPLPMADFIDAFVIGESEEAIVEIAACIMEAKAKGYSRRRKLEALSKIAGLFVPAEHQGKVVIEKRLLTEFASFAMPISHIIPAMQTVHDRVVVEIARGCTHGCRFCQAGFVWRPVRERPPNTIKHLIREALRATGGDEISLLALSTGDYSHIQKLIADLMEECAPQNIALSLPSLRVEALSEEILTNIKKVRKTNFTLAPEAATQRLRDLINKGNTSDDLLKSAQLAQRAGWQGLKLYFMIGLPTETKADIRAIAELARSIGEVTKRKMQITVSLSTFVPKPHTPFQWQRQIDMEETAAKQETLKALRGRNISVKWHDKRMSLLEGVFARAGREIGRCIQEAFNSGCRFDGWTDTLRFDLWEKALAHTGVESAGALAARGRDDAFAWDFVKCGVHREYLWQENEKAQNGELTGDCRRAVCHNCGVCAVGKARMVYALQEDEAASLLEDPSRREIEAQIPRPANTEKPSAGRTADNKTANERTMDKDTDKNTDTDTDTDTDNVKSSQVAPIFTYRFCFSKTSQARFLSHLETATALIKAFRRVSTNIAYSQGFHPQAKISFPTALAVGMQSYEEFAHISFTKPLPDPQATLDGVNKILPEGIHLLSITEITPPASSPSPSPSHTIAAFEYRIVLDVYGSDTNSWSEFAARLASFQSASEFKITCQRGEKKVTRDIKKLVQSIELLPAQQSLTMCLVYDANGSLKPSEALEHLLGVNKNTALSADITKVKTIFHDACTTSKQAS